MTTDLHPEVLYKAEEQEEVRPSQICANCGHDKSWHFVGRDGEMKCRFPHPKCLCKKFESKKKAIVLNDAERYYKSKEKPKNHSRELLPVQRGTDVLGKRLKPADTPSVNSKSPFEITEGTQNQENTFFEDWNNVINPQNHKKGCGKSFGWVRVNGILRPIICNERQKCPTCQEKEK